MSNSLQPHGLYTPWNSPGQNTRVGSLSLLQGIFPTQGSHPGLLHCRQILYQLSHKGSPLNNTSFKMPDLQDPKITYLCHHFSADGWTGFAGIEATKSPQETISQTLLHSIQGFINYFWVVQWQVIFIHFSTKGQAVLNFTWSPCTWKAVMIKNSLPLFVPGKHLTSYDLATPLAMTPLITMTMPETDALNRDPQASDQGRYPSMAC